MKTICLYALRHELLELLFADLHFYGFKTPYFYLMFFWEKNLEAYRSLWAFAWIWNVLKPQEIYVLEDFEMVLGGSGSKRRFLRVWWWVLEESWSFSIILFIKVQYSVWSFEDLAWQLTHLVVVIKVIIGHSPFRFNRFHCYILLLFHVSGYISGQRND